MQWIYWAILALCWGLFCLVWVGAIAGEKVLEGWLAGGEDRRENQQSQHPSRQFTATAAGLRNLNLIKENVTIL
jgi:hypothetical protein